MISVKRKILLFMFLIFSTVGCVNGASDNHASQCSEMEGKKFGGGTIESADLMRADDDMSEYCELRGVIVPEIQFEIRLVKDWNGKLHYSGGGGFNGFIMPINKNAVRLGYVDVASDGGHSSFIPNPLSADFARDNEEAVQLFAYKSVPAVMSVAEIIAAQYYNREITHSYFEGCSNGGREGLMAALKNPDLFDGIIVKAPARQFIATYPFSQRNARELELAGARIGKEKLKFVSASVLASCDTVEKDGLVDGIISNTEACRFDANTLRCFDGKAGESCLSDAQLAVIKSYTTPIAAAAGVLNYPAFQFHGREADLGQWDIWLYGTPMRWPIISSIGKKFLNTGIKNLLAKSDEVNVLEWDFESVENRTQIKKMEELIDVTDADLSRFASRGGKLIMWQGSSDVAVPERSTTQYYQQVREVMGEREADKFSRYYIAPAVNHCDGGVGPTETTQLLSVLDKWVQDDSAPSTLVAHDKDKKFSRPLCVYPAYARYKGMGDITKSENFDCASN